MKKYILTLAALLPIAISCCRTPEYTVPAPKDVMMYQVNPRVFAESSSFNAVALQLDSIRQIGANVVWFMPIYEVGKVNSVNSPYCIKDYKALNPEFGTMQEFANVVDECHKRGMAVTVSYTHLTLPTT